MFSASFGPRDWQIEVSSIEPVQYRVGRVAVLRYEVEARTASKTKSETKRFYVKMYHEPERGQRTHRVLQTLSERGVARAGFTVAKPVAYLRDLKALVQEQAPGTSLQQILSEGLDGSAVRKAARALADFRLGRVAGLPHRCLDNEVAILKTAGQLLGWACPHLRAKVEVLVDDIVARLDEVSLEPTHRELRTDHIFLDGDRLTLIDLDSCALSDPVLDPARVLAHLAGLPLRLGVPDDGRWNAAAEDFVEEYFRAVPNAWRSRLLPHYAGALLKEAVDFFRHLEPRWPEKVAILIDEAGAALSRADW